jgi:hypothetical protein
VRLTLLPSDQVTDPALPDFDVLFSVSNPLLVLLQWPVVFPGRRAATDPRRAGDLLQAGPARAQGRTARVGRLWAREG